jgi:hypothetical protein
MTHIVGVVIGGASYIWADTAVTVPSPNDLTLRRTAFGENSSVSSERRVDQGALKIERYSDLLLACAGDSLMAYAIFGTFRQLLSAGFAVDDAFRGSIDSNSPIPVGREVQLCCAFDSKHGSRIIAFNELGNNGIRILCERDYLQLGSAPDHILAYTEAVLSALVENQAHVEPEVFLLLVLATLQRNGPSENLMPNGVGGPYCGVWLGSDGVHWQKDVASFMYSSNDSELTWKDSAITYVRDDVLVAVPAIGRAAVFLSPSSNVEQWRDRHWPSTVRHVRAGHVDYVSFLDTAARRATVVRMNQELVTKKATIALIPDDKGLKPQIGVAAELLTPLMGPLPPPTIPGGCGFACTYVPNEFYPAEEHDNVHLGGENIKAKAAMAETVVIFKIESIAPLRDEYRAALVTYRRSSLQNLMRYWTENPAGCHPIAVSYFMTEVRQAIELMDEPKKDRYRWLRLYCDLCFHDAISRDRVAQDLLYDIGMASADAIDRGGQAVDDLYFKVIPGIFSPEKLRLNLKDLFAEIDLSSEILENNSVWAEFVKGICSHIVWKRIEMPLEIVFKEIQRSASLHDPGPPYEDPGRKSEPDRLNRLTIRNFRKVAEKIGFSAGVPISLQLVPVQYLHDHLQRGRTAEQVSSMLIEKRIAETYAGEMCWFIETTGKVTFAPFSITGSLPNLSIAAGNSIVVLAVAPMRSSGEC